MCLQSTKEISSTKETSHSHSIQPQSISVMSNQKTTISFLQGKISWGKLSSNTSSLPKAWSPLKWQRNERVWSLKKPECLPMSCIDRTVDSEVSASPVIGPVVSSERITQKWILRNTLGSISESSVRKEWAWGGAILQETKCRKRPFCLCCEAKFFSCWDHRPPLGLSWIKPSDTMLFCSVCFLVCSLKD